MKKISLLVCLSLILMVTFMGQGTVLADDGTYVGVGSGNGGEVEVEVEISEGDIVSIEVLDHNETPGIADAAFEEVPANIKEAQSTDVDVASGATVTSEAIIEAVENAIGSETYVGVAEGRNGDIEVEVEISEGDIVNIEVLDHSETAGIADIAFDHVPAEIKNAQSTDVDVASGATVTSEAIIEAVEAALDKAN
ncbi:FMN-binding protein [Natroniella sulfidigena]|uniref:FMN-binding protein n=1 Tax=Natroniella sulfidigena TaxID=723921 RepID=UPI00200A144E|nr:FMN-binding protein [Natroniella sulfidigena]MCK8817104.1 FMN-binding protein [Natroniella sulfidigena]